MRKREKNLSLKIEAIKGGQIEEIKTVTPKELAARLGKSPKRVRSILRSSIHRNNKNKSWQLVPEQAR